ncbi:hypothetical protein COW36_06055 [bacterium (Candidatus Blackallbacteria) CG17_big_fil_post_rev_8_21_14_2_50_48_46]|uniref:Lipoprotein n=1 Tax=bacterium (Candidatus Blackallbacteria) CG17_big_fil_post_rev_8_21_14_2_50_48_46 TaxID=2014261 RepID=A0A2M7G7N1_9BACT|nr:MAG: hypothetical protein COW64_16885 [bacterium (Candidatus Blackallbacteria) CG18_big_fil_WC_8_21_14_2_50_49_26]PIW18092.1 MAG: hypothetical protein COW36_06055 [bacterium (Candidatus Blackallbacteria) CG17_big_fil_post_rev_8_21_14_2_50_48_46]PIW51101.1 MAG: hypothetical protein COW20_00205 [bacterium (Candidatus Blackallbacteria) CG13_big_fil_rev_8_21_14_2_50_49_14]
MPKILFWLRFMLSGGLCALFLVGFSSCAAVFVWLSQENVSWDYLQTKTSGIKLKPALISPQEIQIPLEVIPTFDSALCFSEVTGQVVKNRILIHLKKGLCPETPPAPLFLKIKRLQAGNYEIRYLDDSGVQSPILGQVEVP